MFEIGNRLREARERRGLAVADVERDTRIRGRWIKALEEERFDVLPARVYAIGFLRTYARYLGLEEQQFVDELSSRLEREEEVDVLLPPWPARRRRALRPWILAAVGVVALAVIIVGLIGLGGAKRPTSAPLPSTRRASPPPTSQTTTPRSTSPATHRPAPEIARLGLEAAHGRCWLDARLGSPNGRELHMGTLELGQSLRLSGRRIWIRLGAPTALDATLDGKRVSLPSATPVNVVVTATGVREAP